MVFKNDADCATFIRTKHISFAGADADTMMQQGTIGIVRVLDAARRFLNKEKAAESVMFDATLFFGDMPEPIATEIELSKKNKYGGWNYVERPKMV